MRKWTRREVLKSGVVLSAGITSTLPGEIEASDDPKAVNRTNEALSKIDIAVAGDLLGHLIGTLSRDEGTAAVVGAEVEVTGRTPLGVWKRATTTGENGLFQIDFPLGATGPIAISGKSVKRTIDSGDIAICL